MDACDRPCGLLFLQYFFKEEVGGVDSIFLNLIGDCIVELIANALNNNYIVNLLNKAPSDTPLVKAAIAYASEGEELFKFCLENNIPLTFWCRYDHTVPVKLSILKKFIDLKSPNFVCKLVQHFHSKVIWWKSYGVYIGSANLTHTGWYSNIETGIFLKQDEIKANGIEDELKDFFDELDRNSDPLTDEVYNHLRDISKDNNLLRKEIESIKNKFKKNSIIPIVAPPTMKPNKDSRLNSVKDMRKNKNKIQFLKEWNATLQILRDIANRVSSSDYRPRWIDADVPKGVQADQFLHAYYYKNVMEGNSSRHEKFFEENNGNPENALINAMNWWKTQESAPTNEGDMVSVWAPYLAKKLSKGYIQKISSEEFIEVCSYVNAIRDHAKRVRNETLGLPLDTPTMAMGDKVKVFGAWLFGQRSDENNSPLDVINFVLYGGSDDELSFRLWEALNDKKWKVPHMAISSLGEIVGWALPNKFPPRNGRTSKALKALGYDVKIHSE